jgi:hypothetical protein
MRRFTSLSLLVLLILLVVAAPAGANAKRNETFKLHGWSGMVAVDAEEGPASLERLGSRPFTQLGKATVEQTQVFGVPDDWEPLDLLDDDGELIAGPVFVTGDVVLTSSNGKDVLRGTYEAVVVDAFIPEGWDQPAVGYYGMLTFDGGEGRFAEATGTAEMFAGHCFNVGRGFIDIWNAEVTVQK